MASNYVLEHAHTAERVRQLAFSGDHVQLAGQIDYPRTPPPLGAGYPLIFILHHAGGNTRADYTHYARLGLRAGFAVFRWDKRGTGRSGAGGRGSTTQDAVYAYETALDQPGIDLERVIILAQNEGTMLLGSSYGLFARLQQPAGVILSGNMLDERAILAIDTYTHILIGENDWHNWLIYARNAATAHDRAYNSGAKYYVAKEANRTLMIDYNGQQRFHPGAKKSLQAWLTSI